MMTSRSAKHIAREYGIVTEDGIAMEGPEFRMLTNNDIGDPALTHSPPTRHPLATHSPPTRRPLAAHSQPLRRHHHQVSNPRGLAVEILGQQISSISKLNPQTKVVVMDRKGEVAKDVARACRAAGVRTAYVMDGGFNGYRRQEGLAVDGRDFYEDGPLALAGDQVESLASGLKGALGDRKGAAVVLGSIAAATFVGANLHEVLKFVGVLGIEATIVLRYVLGDERIGDDLAMVLDSFDGLVGGVTSVVGLASNNGEQQRK